MATYRDAVAWIANNDDPDETNVEDVNATVTVKLVADVWGKESSAVASDVIRYRRAALGAKNQRFNVVAR